MLLALSRNLVKLFGIIALSSGFAVADDFSIPNPITIDAGPLGDLVVQGVVSGIGFAQTDPSPPSVGILASKNFGDTISNSLISVSKSTGLIQFHILAGAFSNPMLGHPFSTASQSISTIGTLSRAYIKIVPDKNLSLEIGKLNSLEGATGSFTYRRMNIEGGFPWYVENPVNRGVQLNYSTGPISVSVAWSDGYYSNRYNFISGLISLSTDKHNVVSLFGAGNLGHTGTLEDAISGSGYSSNGFVNSELINDNSNIVGLYDIYNKGKFKIIPEIEYIYNNKNVAFGTYDYSYNLSAMLHVNFDFSQHWSVASGIDYTTSGDSLVSGYYQGYGPGASALGVMITPTYTNGGWFIRNELSYVRLQDFTHGHGFGDNGLAPDQFRDILESGFWI